MRMSCTTRSLTVFVKSKMKERFLDWHCDRPMLKSNSETLPPVDRTRNCTCRQPSYDASMTYLRVAQRPASSSSSSSLLFLLLQQSTHTTPASNSPHTDPSRREIFAIKAEPLLCFYASSLTKKPLQSDNHKMNDLFGTR